MNSSLTSGKIGKSLITFSIPMIFGNLIQQLYNVADTLIVGKNIGPAALAAVGSCYTLMVLLTSIILGLCMGSGVVFAKYYGGKNIDDFKTSIFNSLIFIIIISLIINVLSYILLNKFITWLNIPIESIIMTEDYLKIILSGMIFVTIYNFECSILRSIGNTVTPLVILGFCAFLNIFLDIIFIMNFKMGVAGAAIATVIAQSLSAIYITFYIFIKDKNLLPSKKHLHFNKLIMKDIINNSFLTAIQQSIMNFGILMIQGLVNSFGFYASAAFAVVIKIESFAYMPAQDFGNAFTTYIAQNNGAKKYNRIIEGTFIACKISVLFCIFASILVVLFGKQFMLIFVNIEETIIIEMGIKYLYIVGSSFIGIGILFLLYGLYRGLGKSQISIILTIISLGARVAIAYMLSSISYVGLVGIWYAIPIGWVLADVFGIWYFIKHIKYKLQE